MPFDEFNVLMHIQFKKKCNEKNLVEVYNFFFLGLVNNLLPYLLHEVTSWHYAQTEAPTFLKRGDYIIIEGEWWGDTDYSRFWIKRVN